MIRWSFEGLCINEFEGLEFDTVSGPRGGGGGRGTVMAKTGADALARFGLVLASSDDDDDDDKTTGSRSSLHAVVFAQVAITVFCWLLSYIGLSYTLQRYQRMQIPATKNNNVQQQQQRHGN